MPGMGNHHHAIVTTSGEAQQYFDQGVNLVFGFNHEEAVRSFKRAAELDPKASMPHWGIAWALGPNYNLDVDDDRAKQANTAIAQALMLSTGGPDDRARVHRGDGDQVSDDAKPDRAALARKYADAMRDLSQRYPDDLDAATLYAESLMNLRAWKLWSLDGKPANARKRSSRCSSRCWRAIRIISAPIITTSTRSRRRRHRAARCRARCALDTLAPAAGHLTHMPAHIYARVGDQAAAARANEAGAKADREYFKIAPADGFYGLAYFTHNLHFLADSEMMRGRLAAARQAAAEVAEKMAPHTQMMPMVESIITMKTAVLLRFGRHEEILALPQPPADHPVEVAVVALRTRRRTGSHRQSRRGGEERERSWPRRSTKVPDDALFGGTGLESARTYPRAGRHRARCADGVGARRRTDDAIRLWTNAVAAADKVPYDEPPVFFYPVRESLGAALLLSGKAADAERVFREDLARHPRNARSLFGLQESLDQTRQERGCRVGQTRFDEAWKDADTTLTIEAL